MVRWSIFNLKANWRLSTSSLQLKLFMITSVSQFLLQFSDEADFGPLLVAIQWICPLSQDQLSVLAKHIWLGLAQASVVSISIPLQCSLCISWCDCQKISLRISRFQPSQFLTVNHWQVIDDDRVHVVVQSCPFIWISFSSLTQKHTSLQETTGRCAGLYIFLFLFNNLYTAIF